MHAFNFHHFHFFIFGAGLGTDGDGGITALAVISGGDEGIDGFLQRGGVRTGQADGLFVHVGRGGDAADFADGFLHAFDTAWAAEVNISELDLGIGRLGGNCQGQRKDNRSEY